METYLNLLQKVQSVKWRLRIEALLKGVALSVFLCVIVLCSSIWGAEMLGFNASSIWMLRLLSLAVIAGIAFRFLYLPLRRRISEVQVAQLVEEVYPQLEDRLVTSIEYGSGAKGEGGIVSLLLRDTFQKTEKMDFSVFLNRKRIAIHGIVAAGALAAFVLLLWWGPSFFPYGFSRLYLPGVEAEGNAKLYVKVTPGDLELPKGSDQQVTARLVGFDSPEVILYIRPDSTSSWAPTRMEPEPGGSAFAYLLIDLQSSTRYFVESRGVRSPEYSLKVVDLPRVDKVDLTFHFPEYTGMGVQRSEGEGDITALKGTKVDLLVHVTQPARAARLIFDDQVSIPLAPAGGQGFGGSLQLKHSGSYTVQIESADGRKYTGSPEYQVEATEDEPPKIAITKPLRDLRATSVEEVFSEMKAEDDIGLAKVELRFSVNGGEERNLALYRGTSASKNVTASHTFFLEEFGLQPGDLISYYGRATDNNNVTGPGVASSDIYFIQVRPFEQKYVQNQQGPGAGGGGGGEGPESLSRQQKEIVSATFKLLRDKDKTAAKEFIDDVKALALVQGRLQAQAQGLVERIQRRGAIEISEQFAKLADYLRNAIGEMGKAAEELGAQKPAAAITPEQKALQQLLRAESLFREIQISMGNAAGGARASQANAEDLADLFELELNKLKNQYETVQRGEQEARDQKIDEALQRLKDLAQRQQQINERNRMLAQKGAASGSGGGNSGNQQQLAEEAEKLQRQLERLSRERSSPELAQAESRLQQALQEMKRSLQRNPGGGGQETTAQGIRALQRLEEAQRSLSLSKNADLNRAVQQALEESGRLVEEQNRIQEGISRLSQGKEQIAAQELQRNRETLSAQKGLLADQVKNLADKIASASRDARKTQKEASGKLNDAADIVRDRRLSESILSSKQLLDAGNYSFLKGREESIRRSLEDIKRQLESARASLGQPPEDKLEDAMQKTRYLADALESMQGRLNSRRASQEGGKGSPQQGAARQPGKKSGAEENPAGGQSSQDQAGTPPQEGKQSGTGAPGGRQQGMQNGQGGSSSPDANGQSTDGLGPPIGIGRYSDEASRQLRRELQQRMTDAFELRRLLDRYPTQAKNLDQVIQGLRRAEDGLNSKNPELVARLRQATDLLHLLEQELNRDLDRLTQKAKYFYSDEKEVPAQYKKLVEEYYKSLARVAPQ